MAPEDFLLACCAVVYAGVGLLIGVRANRTAVLLLSFGCLLTSAWAGFSLWMGGGVADGVMDPQDLVRAVGWFGFLFYLYREARLGRPLHEAGFAAVGVAAGIAGAVAYAWHPVTSFPVSVFSLGIMARLSLAVVELLLIENLYLNLPSHARWHVALPSVLLGGLACFDILLCADVVLFTQPSAALEGARTLGMIMVAPLLLVASARRQRLKTKVKLSRTAVFHSATLVLSGSVLMALGLAGEASRQLGGKWAWLVEASLVFAVLMGLALLLTSGSARSRFQRVFVEHFFAERYDYRRQWQACIRTLSGADGDLQSGLATRGIRTVVAVVDSPAGALFLREGGAGPFIWAGSWNMPATDAIPEGHAVVESVQDGTWIARLDGARDLARVTAPLDALGPLWLAVPLVHRGVVMGLVLAAPPRAPFPLEQEVFDLLRIVAQEVATYIAEQRATHIILQTRQLHDYSKRFAFVAHDIKNVSSQLALLLSNAESHIANPAFQKDMIGTVQSSVNKITALLQRLEQPETDHAPVALTPLPRVEALVATYRRVRQASLTLEHDGSTGSVAMGLDAFETALTHLLNNAVEASERMVVVRVRHEASQVVVEIVDSGPGMTAEFIRDELFRPFGTSKPGGSGIGAFQARELARQAGGDLVVVSRPGAGTTMRLLLPRTDVRRPSFAMDAGAMAAGALS